MKFNGPRARNCNASKLLDVLQGTSGHGPYGWNVNVTGVSIDRSELDKKVTFALYGRDSHQANRRVIIAPVWSIHPRYGEPDTFLGYSVEDTSYSKNDGYVGRHLTFDEALEAVEARIVKQYGRGPDKVQDYQTMLGQQQYDNLSSNEDYDELRSAAEQAIEEYADYHNHVKLDSWNSMDAEMVREEATVNNVLGVALSQGHVEWDKVYRLRVVLGEMMEHA